MPVRCVQLERHEYANDPPGHPSLCAFLPLCFQLLAFYAQAMYGDHANHNKDLLKCIAEA